jgi:DNA polymerase-3 subunit beta
VNITINSQLLAAELRLLSKIVPAKPAIAILSHALLRADDSLHLYATDLEVGLSTSCDARVSVPGTAAVPVAKLLSLVEQFTDGDVTIALDKSHVIVKCSSFTSRLQTLSAHDFPEPKAVEGTSRTLDATALRQLIARTRYAVSAANSKYVLKGSLLTLSGPVAVMAATDSKRLALASTSRIGPDARVIIPAKTLDVLAGQADEGDIELTIGSRHLFFAVGGRLLTSRTIDGEFPKYERVIPRDNDKIVTADRNVLAAALRRVGLVSEESGAVYLDVAPGTIGLSARSYGIGSADETVEVAYDGLPLRVCVNGGYILDFLNAASEPMVTLALKDTKGAMLLTDSSDHVAVIMLMSAQ